MRTMASNETNPTNGRNTLMGQQLDDNEIQEILKSGTGNWVGTIINSPPPPKHISNQQQTFFRHILRRTDLRHYSQQIERDLKGVENQSIEEYIRESENISSLHSQIGDCDNILERMESMLTNFQVIPMEFLVSMNLRWKPAKLIQFMWLFLECTE